MGNLNHKKHHNTFDSQNDKLEFYTDVVDPHVGKVKIYASKNRPPLKFIMKYQQKQGDTKIYNTFKMIEVFQDSPLLQLYGFNLERRVCCDKILTEKVTSFWKYYNFYFNQYLDKRTRFQCDFIDSEIWHIVDTFCETYTIFHKFGIFYEIDPRTFLITPEGKLKAFWCHLKTHNRHIKFYQYFEKKFAFQAFYYSPEEIEYFHKKNLSQKINFDKCNSFRLGMVLLYCLTLTQPLHACYNPSMTKINFKAIKNLINTKVIPNYPDQITNLVKDLLQFNSKARPTLMEVYQHYAMNFSPEFELKVCGSSESEKKTLSKKIESGQITQSKEKLSLSSLNSSQKTVKIARNTVRH